MLELTVKDGQTEGVLVEFIKKHGSEVANMLYTQWNWDDAMAVEREEAYAEGVFKRFCISSFMIYSCIFLK